MSNPRFSIITVCYNAEQDISETMQSLLRQTFTDYECIIKDGGSTDRTMDIAREHIHGNRRARVIQEPDNGIFDAMNAAVGLAEGELVFFLNAGDCFSDDTVLERVDRYMKENPETEIAFGNIIQVGNGQKTVRVYSNICSKKVYFLTGDCICHQALFARRELLEQKPFDLTYHVCGDKEWQLYQVVHGKKYGHMDFSVAEVKVEGFSMDHVEEFEAETLAVIKKYCPILVYGHMIVMGMKKSTLLKKALRSLGGMLFQKSCR